MSELDLLAGVPTFLNLVERFKQSRDPRPFTKLFMAGGTETADGDEAIVERLVNDRKIAAARGRRSDAYQFDPPDNKYIKSGLIHTKIKEVLYPDELFLKAAAGSPMRSNAGLTIARAASRLYNRMMLLREYVCARLLQDAGGVAINPANIAFEQGAIKQSITVTMEGGLVTLPAGAVWTNAATKILSGPTQLPDFLDQIEANGYEGVRFLIGRALAKAIMGNTEAQTWLTTNGGVTIDTVRNFAKALTDPGSVRKQDPFAPNILSGLGSVPLWHIFNHGYEDRNGAFTRFMDQDKAILLPDLATEGEESPLTLVEGPVITPDGNQAISNGEQAQELFSQSRGIAIWAYRAVGDSGELVLVGEDSFLPMVKDNNAILSVTGLA